MTRMAFGGRVENRDVASETCVGSHAYEVGNHRTFSVRRYCR
jgi:hypothetical protein